MNVATPNNKVVALQGLILLHLPLFDDKIEKQKGGERMQDQGKQMSHGCSDVIQESFHVCLASLLIAPRDAKDCIHANFLFVPITILPVSDWEDKWIDVYFDISSKLLDICNAFSYELSRLN
ncbi:hypothetical protein JHK85_012749 [Glycine max]|nr:hypothetical protein JHK85_012749 [Glycine max]KAG5057419.1 hypothetical protein JHK86_012415 [Glycine max]